MTFIMYAVGPDGTLGPRILVDDEGPFDVDLDSSGIEDGSVQPNAAAGGIRTRGHGR